MTRPTRNGTDGPSGCDREALHALVAGLLDPAQSKALLDHVRGCPACRADLPWIDQVDRLLGFTPSDHPSAADIVEFASDALDGPRRAALAGHFSVCAPCKDLVETARDALAEYERIEKDVEELRRKGPWKSLLSAFRTVLAVPSPGLATATADSGTPVAPVPEDRRVLLEEPEVFRVVYWREGGHGLLAVFTESPGEPEVLACTIDGKPLPPAESEEGILFPLGLVEDLFGRELALKLRLHGVERDLAFCVVEG